MRERRERILPVMPLSFGPVGYIKKVGEGLGWSFAYRRGENSKVKEGARQRIAVPLIPSAPSSKLSAVRFVFKKFLPILPIFRNPQEPAIYESVKN